MFNKGPSQDKLDTVNMVKLLIQKTGFVKNYISNFMFKVNNHSAKIIYGKSFYMVHVGDKQQYQTKNSEYNFDIYPNL